MKPCCEAEFHTVSRHWGRDGEPLGQWHCHSLSWLAGFCRTCNFRILRHPTISSSVSLKVERSSFEITYLINLSFCHNFCSVTYTHITKELIEYFFLMVMYFSVYVRIINIWMIWNSPFVTVLPALTNKNKNQSEDSSLNSWRIFPTQLYCATWCFSSTSVLHRQLEAATPLRGQRAETERSSRSVTGGTCWWVQQQSDGRPRVRHTGCLLLYAFDSIELCGFSGMLTPQLGDCCTLPWV